MKRFINWALTLLSILFFLTCFMFATAVDAKEKYQCFAELYPELAEKHHIPGLKESYVYDDGVEYFVLAECKHLTRNSWFIWFDISNFSPDDKLDDICDKAIGLLLIDGQLIVRALPCDHAFEMVHNYCKDNNISLKEFVH